MPAPVQLLSRRIAPLAAAALVAGCGSAQQATTLTAQQSRLDRNRRFLVTVPPDGRYGETTYAGSGDSTARALQPALMEHAARVDLGGAAVSQDAAFAAARAAQADYLVFPLITHWEDRATEWSGLPDRIEVIVSVLEMPNGQLLTRSAITGRSSWWTLGGDKPQDLLATPTGVFAASLF